VEIRNIKPLTKGFRKRILRLDTFTTKLKNKSIKKNIYAMRPKTLSIMWSWYVLW